jgi:hypothetical protein
MLGTIERAFELAKNGTCADFGDIRRRLMREGFDDVHEHLSGAEIKRQLITTIKAASSSQDNNLGGARRPDVGSAADGRV